MKITYLTNDLYQQKYENNLTLQMIYKWLHGLLCSKIYDFMG